MKAENNTRTIKAALQPLSGIRHPKTFMVILEVNHSIHISGSGGIFQSEESNSIVAESME